MGAQKTRTEMQERERVREKDLDTAWEGLSGRIKVGDVLAWDGNEGRQAGPRPVSR